MFKKKSVNYSLLKNLCILVTSKLNNKPNYNFKQNIQIKHYTKISIIYLLSCQLWFTANAQLVINEVVSCNQTGIVDREQATPDWIEIFNYSDQAINLGTYYLSDKPSNPKKWRFPNINLNRKAHVLILASGKNLFSPAEIHTNFKIDSDGETLVLSNVESIIHQIKLPIMACDFSLGYLNNDMDSLVVFNQPTPGYPNYETGVEAPILFSHQSGFYKNEFNLFLSSVKDAEIRYTLNTALEPTVHSNLYKHPFNITSREGEDNVFSEIPTTDSIGWRKPEGKIFKTNIVRAAAFINGQQVSKVYTKSYGVSPLGHQRYSFPVVSLVVQPHQLFSATEGIYVLGNNYELYSQPNFNYDWERDVFVEFFENNGEQVFSQQAQIEIAGQTTRWRRQKSLKLKASGKGNKNRFDYAFFNKELKSYKTLILRSTFADYRKSFIKDELLNQLAEQTRLADADCRPVVVFLNGEYWGIHILEEKQDKYYLEDHYEVDKDSIDLLKGNATQSYEIIEGAGTEYLQLRAYAINNDLSDSKHFDYVAEQMNIENFIDYYCFNMLVATRDWPWNNMKYWRPKDQSRKWEWIPHDFDSSYNYPETDGFYLASEPINETVAWSVVLYNNLMENLVFKSRLLLRLEDLLNHEFCTDSIALLIDEHKKRYAPEIEEHIHRWNFEETYSWEEELEVYYTFPKVLAKTLKRIANNNFNYDMSVCDNPITSIDTFDQETYARLVIYPNPAINALTIHVKNPEKINQLKIIDITGNSILEINYIYQLFHEIDVSNLPAGVYFVQTLSNQHSVLSKFVKLY